MNKVLYTTEDNILSCSHNNCGENHMHQVGFIWFQRKEDEAEGKAIYVCQDGVFGEYPYEDGDDSPNPSSRRHGSIIVFSCEACGELTGVNYAQHKGLTIIESKPLNEKLLYRNPVFEPNLHMAGYMK